MLSKGTILTTAFDEFKVVEQIGQGGNGTVFLVKSGGEQFAIKVIDKKKTNGEKIKRFQNEINFCQKNRHDNLIKVLDYGPYKDNDRDCMFYVMPYYDSNLRKEIERGIDPEHIIPLFFQILNGIEFIHEKNVWHRDIKPENILFDSEKKKAVVADLGIAHFCKEDLITAVETQNASRLANFIYAAPEQRIKGQEVNGRADVYALGLILNEMFTKTPISGSKFKKIGDINKKYEFLDQVVEELINQDQDYRLYPVNRVYLEIEARFKIERNKAELDIIMQEQRNKNEFEDPLFTPLKVTDIQMRDGHKRMIFYLDKPTNTLWNEIFKNERFSYGKYVDTYSPKAFKRYDTLNENAAFSLEFSFFSEIILEDIVIIFKSWLPKIAEQYKKEVIQKRELEQQRVLEQKEKEIKEKKEEMQMREKLLKLI